MTMEKIIEIPADRHLRLDLTLPESFSAGQARIILLDNAAIRQPSKPGAGAKKPLRGFFKGSAFTVDRFLAERRAGEGLD